MTDCVHDWIPAMVERRPARLCARCYRVETLGAMAFRRTFGFSFRQVVRAQQMEEEKARCRALTSGRQGR